MYFVISRSYRAAQVVWSRSTSIPLWLSRSAAGPCMPSKSVCPPQKNPCGTGSGGGGGKHSVRYKPYVAPVYTDHDAKNMGMKRPMSPHLTIYAPTIPAMTSIAQRITGVILTSFAFSISFATLFLSNGIESYVSIVQSLDFSRPLMFLVKLLVGLPFAYHYFFGIRFIIWNAGKWLDMKQVYASAKTMGIAAVVVTFLFALL